MKEKPVAKGAEPKKGLMVKEKEATKEKNTLAENLAKKAKK